MDFGICVASRPTDIDYVVEAESLGFTHAWMADSQMIWSDVYAMLALAADRTSTINIGTGVAVAGTRPAPVTAAQAETDPESEPAAQRTQPRVWQGREIPEVLLSGHHGRIADWRRAEAERITRDRRPELWAAYQAARGD